jgi:hypothetical protein
MVDRYTKVVLTVIAAALIGLMSRPLLEVPTVGAQLAACGLPERPCHVSIAGGPPAGTWQGAPMVVFDPQAEARAQAQAQVQQTCGAPANPCYAVIIGGPGGPAGWQGWPLLTMNSQQLVPRRNP